MGTGLAATREEGPHLETIQKVLAHQEGHLEGGPRHQLGDVHAHQALALDAPPPVMLPCRTRDPSHLCVPSCALSRPRVLSLFIFTQALGHSRVFVLFTQAQHGLLFFYVGAQITCWTFIIQYGTRVFMAQGMSEQAAEVLSQRYNIVAMVIFCLMRFVNLYLMKYIKPGRLMAFFAAVALALLCGVIFVGGHTGMCCLVAVSACMSLMFPTIYGLALGDVGEDAELGSAGLIMAILGGSVLPALQAMIIDSGVTAIPAVNLSFIVPALCFVVVMRYGLRQSR